jgi:hypothetical protein
MKRLVVGLLVVTGSIALAAPSTSRTWSVEADYIEACSCHLFCPCFFNKGPEAHHCEYNTAIKIVTGHFGDVNVDGTRVWLSGDLGEETAKGALTSIVIFDAAVTPPQQEAIKHLLDKIYPLKPQKPTVYDRAPILWEQNGSRAHARLGKGEAEITLTGVAGADGQQAVVQNVPYWGAQKNNGFHLAKSEHHYQAHGLSYSYKDRNGFTIRVSSSGTVDSK